MTALGKKPSLMAARSFSTMCQQVSKAALIDALWCACQLGTNESPEEITTQAARNLSIALGTRGDRIPADIVRESQQRVDSD